jgi:formylglycine-generating enzyme required for sulfatase activity
LIDILLATMRADGTVPALMRARAGAQLGWLGDPRFDPNAFWLPVATEDDPFRGFLIIPAPSGPFLMARWPVTVAQFQAYVRDSRERVGNPTCLNDPPTQPVRWVSYEEAERYCAWFSRELLTPMRPLATLGEALAKALGATHVSARLPRDAEWNHVAHGGDERRSFPWGAAFDVDKMNISETGIGAPSPVGCFPAGAARWGIEELFGNVYEFVSDPNNSTVTSEVRGIAFDTSTRSLRISGVWGDTRRQSIGFRVVVSALSG